ncbi:hypothetical protein F5Y16DRAFT_157658 [Xylariaceae sp. FL0255]|nr:hypothetical protein F5Y16DRAFT_157658 [Xylariaceae sp. FL0255]
MPRPRKPGAEPKRRSRDGCWPCKNRKVKCGEEHPACLNCQRTGETCDYSIRLNWDGRRGKHPESGIIDFSNAGQSSLPTTVPAKGFKLVHQNPLSDTPGLRRLEPLTGPSTQAKQDSTSSPSRSLTSSGFEDTTSPIPQDADTYPNKRAKLGDAPAVDFFDRRPYSSHSSALDSTSGTRRPPRSSSASAASPMTPATSSTYSDDDHRQTPRTEAKMSVSSLLAGPPSLRALCNDGASQMLPPLDTRARNSDEPTFYGIDRGLPDQDLGKNDDMNAIGGSSPVFQREVLHNPSEEPAEDAGWNEFGFGVETNDADEAGGGYYAKPVPIFIPRNLEPLPLKLIENPMNLLYFHHFLNHTARVLVPYDDPHANPFRTILPRMAVKNDNLLALLLAYSASHRARVLGHPEPTLRIAFWVDDIFPTLREALNDPDRNFSNANLATAIMLASLDIISPKVFGYDIPWQKHLSLARELITVRPGGLRGYQSNFRQDPVCSFLWSWAAYLDVIGNLSGGPKDASSAWIFDYELDDIVDGYDEIDCIMGFTTRCVYLLSKIADLARRCDAERIDDDHNIIENWLPNPTVLDQAERLEAAVHESMLQQPVPCKHIHKEGDIQKWDFKELGAINSAFHWAALVQLYRRVQGRQSEDEAVQHAVEQIIVCVGHIRPGGSAESCLLFPMFTAGCDTQSEQHRNLILGRFMSAENHGMTQVHRARRLMQRVWETKKPWETLVSTEFIG